MSAITRSAGLHVTPTPVQRCHFALDRSAAHVIFVRHILIRQEGGALPRKVLDSQGRTEALASSSAIRSEQTA